MNGPVSMDVEDSETGDSGWVGLSLSPDGSEVLLSIALRSSCDHQLRLTKEQTRALAETMRELAG